MMGCAARMLLPACALWLVAGMTARCTAGDVSAGKLAGVDYLRDVKPLLSKRCYVCHGALKQKAGLRLDTAALMRKGGDSGPAIIAGQSDESLIIEAVTGREGWRMPPEGEGTPLSAQEIATVRAWIDQGAQRPGRRASPGRPAQALGVPARRSDPPCPQLPATRGDWVRNPIDAFLAATT